MIRYFLGESCKINLEKIFLGFNIIDVKEIDFCKGWFIEFF